MWIYGSLFVETKFSATSQNGCKKYKKTVQFLMQSHINTNLKFLGFDHNSTLYKHFNGAVL